MRYEIQRPQQAPLGTYPTMRDAVTAFNALIATNPPPFDNIEAHPDFVAFARFDRRVVAVGDEADTLALVRVA